MISHLWSRSRPKRRPRSISSSAGAERGGAVLEDSVMDALCRESKENMCWRHRPGSGRLQAGYPGLGGFLEQLMHMLERFTTLAVGVGNLGLVGEPLAEQH